LLHHGADPRALSQDGGTFFDSKTRSAKKYKGGSQHGVAPLLAWAGMSALTAAWKQGSWNRGPPLFTGIDEDRLAAGELLLRHGADPNARMPDGRTALFMWTGENGADASHHTAFVALLLRHGADPKIADIAGMTALHLLQGNPEEMPAVEQLVGAGADLNAAETKAGRTPIHKLFPEFTGLNRRIPVLSSLAALGADFNRGDASGDTPFHIAVKACAVSNDGKLVTDVFEELVRLCDPNIKNAKGETALFRLRKNRFHRQFETISRALMTTGIDLEARDNDGRTAIHEAARWRDESLVGLLDLGAGIQARDNGGKTCESTSIDH